MLLSIIMARGRHKKTLNLLADRDVSGRVEAALGSGSRRLNELYGEVVLGSLPPYEAAAVLYEVLGSLKYCMALLNELGRRGLTLELSVGGVERTLASTPETTET